MPVITNAGEYLITQQQQAGEPLIIDQMILANITGLDSNTVPSREQSMPAPEDVKIIKPITKDGLLNTNTVVYSTVFPSTDGTFDFNYMGLYSSAHDVIVAVAYVPLQTKIKTVGTDVGNVITKNFAIEFNAAADITGINISAESWQIDYTARLLSMDKHQRDLVKNIYGPSTFLNDAFKVKFETDKYYLTAGKAILGGINFDLEADLEIVPGALPQTVWLDVYQETSMMGVLNKHDVVINDGTVLTDYVAGSVEHTLVKLAVVNSSVDIVDGRSLVKRSLELTTKNNDPKNVAELRKYRPEYAGQKLDIDGQTLPGIGGGPFYHDPDDSTSPDDNGTVIVNEWGDRWKRRFSGAVNITWFGAVPVQAVENFNSTLAIKSALLLQVDVFVPRGTYLADADALLYGKVYSGRAHRIFGESRETTKILASTAGTFLLAASSYVTNSLDLSATIEIVDLWIDGNNLVDHTVIIRSWRSKVRECTVNGGNIDHVLFTTLSSDGTNLSSTMVNNEVTGSWVGTTSQGTSVNCMRVIDPTRNKASDMIIRDNFMTGGSEFSLRPDVLAGYIVTGNHFYGGDSMLIRSPSVGTNISDNYFEGKVVLDGMIDGFTKFIVGKNFFSDEFLCEFGSGSDVPQEVKLIGCTFGPGGYVTHGYFAYNRIMALADCTFQKSDSNPIKWSNASSTGIITLSDCLSNYYDCNMNGSFSAESGGLKVRRNYIVPDEYSNTRTSYPVVRKDNVSPAGRNFSIDFDYYLGSGASAIVDVVVYANKFNNQNNEVNYIAKYFINAKDDTIFLVAKVSETITPGQWDIAPSVAVAQVLAGRVTITVEGTIAAAADNPYGTAIVTLT